MQTTGARSARAKGVHISRAVARGTARPPDGNLRRTQRERGHVPLFAWRCALRGSVFLKHELKPVNGYVELPDVPGLCTELSEEAIGSREETTFCGHVPFWVAQ